MKVMCSALVVMLAACSSSPRKQEWFDREVTPPGRYQTVKFPNSHDQAIQSLLLRLEKLEPALAKDDEGPADVDARRIIRTMARNAQGPGLTQVCEHIVWQLSSRPSTASIHETYLLDFLGRCQEVIFQMSGDDEPTIENLGSYTLNASRRAAFLRMLIAKADHAVGYFKGDLGVLYGALVCNVLERADWGAVNRIQRQADPEAPGFKKSTLDALAFYRAKISR